MNKEMILPLVAYLCFVFGVAFMLIGKDKAVALFLNITLVGVQCLALYLQ